MTIFLLKLHLISVRSDRFAYREKSVKDSQLPLIGEMVNQTVILSRNKDSSVIKEWRWLGGTRSKDRSLNEDRQMILQRRSLNDTQAKITE